LSGGEKQEGLYYADQLRKKKSGSRARCAMEDTALVMGAPKGKLADKHFNNRGEEKLKAG